MSEAVESEQKEHELNQFTSVPIEVIVSVGRARPMIKDLLMLGKNTVLEIDRKVEDPVELYVGDRLIAKGTLEEGSGENSGGLFVRLTDIISNDYGAR